MQPISFVPCGDTCTSGGGSPAPCPSPSVINVPGPPGPTGPPGGSGNPIVYYTGASPSGPPPNPLLTAVAVTEDGTGSLLVWNVPLQIWN